MKKFYFNIFLVVICIAATNGFAAIPDSSSKSRMELLFELPDAISESSGLIYYRDQFWTFSDSGGGPTLFSIDPKTGRIVRRITITNASNIDWEEITQDENFIYIGDFGNNFGNRKDLKIYKVRKSEIMTEKDDYALSATIISFGFADQKDYK